jgi:hypothetical protein
MINVSPLRRLSEDRGVVVVVVKSKGMRRGGKPAFISCDWGVILVLSAMSCWKSAMVIVPSIPVIMAVSRVSGEVCKRHFNFYYGEAVT